ncbi:MAG TPA: DUF5668 domain-containing protein [Candidatus Limnocylindrales bacterium]|nr:DUF5668 domain-containing protein [Candidatus Limnocylindrales bacterium]
MRLDRRLAGIGLFLVVFGAVLLAARQGWIDPDLVGRAWQLWPLLLIGFGITILVGGRTGSQVGGLLVAAILGVMAAGFFTSGGGFPFIGCGNDRTGVPFAAESGELTGRTSVAVDFRCGDLEVRTAAGGGWSVEGNSERGEAPRIDHDDGRLEIGTADDSPFGFTATREQWTVTLPTAPRLDLDLTLNAGSGTVDLGEATLGSVDMTVNAGSIRLDLRGAAAIDTVDATVNAGSAVVWLPDRALDGGLQVNAGSLSICAPESIGLRLRTGDNPISSNDFEARGLVRVGDAWETPEFSTAAIRISLDAQANAGSLSLNPDRECAG